MTAPVKNNEVPATDPYADGYDSGNDPYGYEDSYGDEGVTPVEDEYGMGEPTEGGAACTTVADARDYVNYLESLLKDSGLSASEKDEIENAIKAISSQINKAAGLKSPEMQQKALTGINDKLCDIENQINGVDAEGGDGSTKSQIEDLKKKYDEYLAAGQISQSTYDKGMKDLEKAEAIYGIEGDSEFGAEQIGELISSATENLLSGTGSSDGAQKLSELTGMTPEELDELFEKHGLDPNNLPNPPDTKVAELLAELGVSTDSANSKYTELQSKIESSTSTANAINQASVASDTSTSDSVDWTPFKFLYEASKHKDDISNALKNERTAVATEAAKYLSALYGTEVTACTDPDKAGMVSFNNTDLNVFTSGGASAKLGFTTTGPEWPDVSLVRVEVDNGGDGATAQPDWVEDAKYPFHEYDTSGSGSNGITGQWSDGDGGSEYD